MRVGGVGEGVGEGLPGLGHHAAVGVGDLDAVVGDGVVGGSDHHPDRRSRFQRPQRRHDPSSEHRRR